jgi:DNA repair protein RecN (Recombination protein N)
MLSELRIRNFALIDQLTLRLEGGLNVLTGETGAGKSIVVGALSLLLGERASSDVVRTGADRASVEGVFEVGGRADVAKWLEERGFEADDDLLVLKREVAVEGRNRVWINASPATAALLGDLGGLLVSLHGQHEHQTLLRRDEQRAILDAFAGNHELVAAVARAHAELTRIRGQIQTLDQRRREAMQRADMLRFQVQEIEAAAVEAGEEERLSEEARRLTHAEELIGLAGSIGEAVASDAGSAVGRLGSARRAIEQLVRIDASQAPLSELFDTAYYALEELGSRLEAYLLVVEHDPERLETVRRRQDLLFRLRSKYGPTLDDVLQTLETAKRELALVEDAAWELTELERRRDQASMELETRAAELTERREQAMQTLASEVNRILPELGMEGGGLFIVRLPLDRPGSSGAEEIEFRISLNRGFEPKPIAQVASGGELSRVMLALKTVLARLESVPTLVFDEVDAGIGGRVALHVGDKMRQIAGDHQVLAITHLPQIASRAHHHLLVSKQGGVERTSTSVVTLEADQRVREVARMLGGDPDSEASLTHARELLDKGRAFAAA